MQILGEAIEREPELRDGWVDTVCAGDEALQLRVELLHLMDEWHHAVPAQVGYTF